MILSLKLASALAVVLLVVITVDAADTPGWFPHTGAHDTEAAKIPDKAKPKYRYDNMSVQSKGHSVPGPRTGEYIMVPNPSQGGASVSGAVESSLGPVKKRAELGTWTYIYADSTKKQIVGWGACFVRGELFVTMEHLTAGPSNKFIENAFAAEDFGRRFVLIKLDPAKHHRLCFDMSEDTQHELSLDQSLLTASYPGSKLTTAKGTFVRRANRWDLASGRAAGP